MKWLPLLVLAGCGSTGGEADGPDGAAADARLGPDAGPCGALDPSPSWLDDSLVTVLATAQLLHDTCRQRGVIVAFFDQEDEDGDCVSQTDTSGTDHPAFRNDGFVAAGVTEEYVGGDTTPYYHQSGDQLATVAESTE